MDKEIKGEIKNKHLRIDEEGIQEAFSFDIPEGFVGEIEITPEDENGNREVIFKPKED